jgi:hypothetical protein
MAFVTYSLSTYNKSNTFSLNPNGGNVGIGVQSPMATLHIDSKTANVSGLRFTQLNSGSPTVASAAILGVDATGNVVTTTATSNKVIQDFSLAVVPSGCCGRTNPLLLDGYEFSLYIDLPTNGGFQAQIKNTIGSAANIVIHAIRPSLSAIPSTRVKTALSIPANTWTDIDANVYLNLLENYVIEYYLSVVGTSYVQYKITLIAGGGTNHARAIFEKLI